MPSASSNSIGFAIPVQRSLPQPLSPTVVQPQSPFDEILRPAEEFPSSGECFYPADPNHSATPTNVSPDDSRRSERTGATLPAAHEQDQELPAARGVDEERGDHPAPSDEPTTEENPPPDAAAESVLAAASVVAPLAIINTDGAGVSEMETEATAGETSTSVPAAAVALVDDQSLSAKEGLTAVVGYGITGNLVADEVLGLAVAEVTSSGDALDSETAEESADAEVVEPEFSDPDAESHEERNSPVRDRRLPDTANALPVDPLTAANAPQAAAGTSFSDRIGNGNQSGQPSAAPLLATGVAPEAQRARLPAEVLTSDTHSRPAAAGGVDSARLLHRVARAFAAAADRGGEVTLRLSPPELGLLKIEVQVHESVLVARIEAETLDARSAILENLPALRERLTEQGVRIERFDVDLMNRQPGGAPHQPFDDQREARRAWQADSPPTRAEKTPLPRIAVPLTAKPGGLNVIV